MRSNIFLLALSFTFLVSSQELSELMVKRRIDIVSTLAREPMVAEHPNGSLFVTGYRNASDSPQLWQSVDKGLSWNPVSLGGVENGAIGNSDVDLYIDFEGNIFLLSMSYTKFPENMEGFDFSTMKGQRITLGVSRDAGKSWKWQTISENDYDDRPWIRETSNGTLHIIWNDGNGVHHVSSVDKGRTWQLKEDISKKGGSSFMAAGKQGQLAVRVAPLSASAFKMDEGYDLIQLSKDNGNSWKEVQIPGKRKWSQNLSGIPRWVEPLAWEDNGALYMVWSEGMELKLGVTQDDGLSWKEHVVFKSNDTLYFPFIKMSKKGILCTWVSGFGNDIRHHAMLINVSEKDMKTYALDPKQLDLWSRFTTGKYQRSTGGEYFPIIPLDNGNFGMVTTIRNSKAEREGFTW